MKNGNVEAFTYDEDSGFGIRVLFRGAWGFASSSRTTKTEMEAVFTKALKIARASYKARGGEIVFSPTSPKMDQYRTSISIDPFEVPSEKKLNLLLTSDEIIRRNKNVKIAEAFMGSYKTEKIFASTEGSYIEQDIVECGAAITATAIDRGEVQVRSYPNSFRGSFATRGYEWIEALVLQNHGERIAEEAVQLLSAKPCPSKETTLIHWMVPR